MYAPDHDYWGADVEQQGRFKFVCPTPLGYPERRGRTRRQRPFQEPFNFTALPSELQLMIVEQVSGMLRVARR